MRELIPLAILSMRSRATENGRRNRAQWLRLSNVGEG
jgi:hypothetical protein